MSKKEYLNKCFFFFFIEIDLDEISSQTAKEGSNSSDLDVQKTQEQYNKEVRLESRRRKDLNTLLKELDEIKQSIERAAEKQHRLANLMSFYTGEFAN